ncbi:MAG TPA: hypothetical protein VFT22_16870 [Kofleriaceae bacterium]|nr:hypothetical protein [Kofleriaceae bacterium]
MKKSTTYKLVLRSQTIRQFATEALDCIAGGGEPVDNGFIMKDTIIIRTGGIVSAPLQDGR